MTDAATRGGYRNSGPHPFARGSTCGGTGEEPLATTAHARGGGRNTGQPFLHPVRLRSPRSPIRRLCDPWIADRSAGCADQKVLRIRTPCSSASGSRTSRCPGDRNWWSPSPHSMGLGMIVAITKRIRSREGSLRLVCSPERLLKVFKMGGLRKVYPFHDSVAKATRHAPRRGGLANWPRNYHHG
ncbi:STAS domain-containing protein [Streptomyces spiralis]